MRKKHLWIQPLKMRRFEAKQGNLHLDETLRLPFTDFVPKVSGFKNNSGKRQLRQKRHYIRLSA